ncbi:MAG: hypothetical protein RIR70_1018 [Pseudomonadota bacterium]
MTAPYLLPHLIDHSASREPGREALRCGFDALDYATLAGQMRALADGLLGLDLGRRERVAVFMDKRVEAVVACFGALAAGGVMVPINPLLRAPQVGHILRDCNVRVLITTRARLAALADELPQCHDLHHVVQIDGRPDAIEGITTHSWFELQHAPRRSPPRLIDADLAAILYTSGSTGRPRGVMLTHRNMLCGAHSVAQYLENTAEDSLLAVLPLSFDAGFSQLTTAFLVGARVVLLNYLLPRDVITLLEGDTITGITAVPPIWMQLAHLDWSARAKAHLRYIASTGGKMPRELVSALQSRLPKTRITLMYGLTEAFRSTWLPPEELATRPDSIGRAIPNTEILVLREDGTPCGVNEPGELVHRGAQVALGYWNDPQKTAERFRPLPRAAGEVRDEIAVFSGDTVRRDEDGFLYFIGRRDEMIKTSGYRVSPTEVEEVLYAAPAVMEAAVFGVPHPSLGEAIVGVVAAKAGAVIDEHALLRATREALPGFMVPLRLIELAAPLPRNANGKLDRLLLAQEYRHLFQSA